MLDQTVMDAMLRGIALFQKLKQTGSPILDLYPIPLNKKLLNYTTKTETYLGVSLPIQTQIDILEGWDVKSKKKIALSVAIQHFDQILRFG